MARPQLASLLVPRGNEEDTAKLGLVPPPEAPSAPAAAPDTAPDTDADTPAAPGTPAKDPRRSNRPRATKPAKASAAEDVPPYLRFERKEARLRADQLTGLTLRARQLNKTKDRDADRITDNTLIRVAVDLLLSRADQLSGGDEDALRRSLGLKSEV